MERLIASFFQCLLAVAKYSFMEARLGTRLFLHSIFEAFIKFTYSLGSKILILSVNSGVTHELSF